MGRSKLTAKQRHSLRGKKFQKNKLARLHGKLWKLFSIHVRAGAADWRGYVTCFTCPKRDHWRTFDAGHYKHGVMDFNPKNVNPQCSGCNRFWHGRLDEYASRLIKTYGVEILDELDKGANEERLRRTQTGNAYLPESEYLELITKYEQLTKEFG